MRQKLRCFGKEDLQPIQDLGILGSQDDVLFGIPLGVFKQGISSSISFALMIIDPKVVSKQLLSSTNLSRAQTFGIYEVSQVVIVHKDENLMLITF